jgi:hypothetical protein
MPGTGISRASVQFNRARMPLDALDEKMRLITTPPGLLKPTQTLSYARTGQGLNCQTGAQIGAASTIGRVIYYKRPQHFF